MLFPIYFLKLFLRSRISRNGGGFMAKGEVLIVGAGPTGLLLSILLTREKVPFKVIDKKSGPTTHSKALAMHARTLEVLQDIGLSEQFLQAGKSVKGMQLENGKEILAQMDLSILDTKYNSMHVIPQSETERILCDTLKEQKVPIHWETELCDFEYNKEIITVYMKRKEGNIIKEEFTWVIGCDGMHSCVRDKNEILFEGTDITEAFALADLHIHGELDSNFAHVSFANNREGVVFFIPLPNGKWRMIVNNCLLEHKEDANNEYFTRMIQERYDKSMSTSQIDWATVFHIHYREASQFSKGNFFLVGDAAHVHSPIGGQGMNTGLQDAYNLSWKLGFVYHGQAKKKLLETYHEERHANATKLLRSTKFLTNLIAPTSRFMKWLKPYLIKWITRERIKKKLMRMISQLEVNYRNMSLSITHKASFFSKNGRYFNRGPKAGERTPDAKIEVVGKPEIHSVYEFISGPLFNSFIFLSDAKNLDTDELSEVKRYKDFDKIKISRYVRNIVIKHKEFLENEKEYLQNEWTGNVILDEDGSFHERYHARRPCLYVIRADNYIGLKSHTIKFHNLRKYFARILDDL